MVTAHSLSFLVSDLFALFRFGFIDFIVDKKISVPKQSIQ